MHRLKQPLRRIKRRVLVEFNRPSSFGKTDLVHVISKKLNLTNYLELCTHLSGNFYRDVNRSRFNTARRLMYNCPADFDDGLPIDFRIAGFDIDRAFNDLKAQADKVDICLVDGWHTYDCAIRDLTCAYDLLADGGVLVVHDCLPPTEFIASPTWHSGEWSGVNYRAYLDFVLDRTDLCYCTVDVDYGCGIIFKGYSIVAEIVFPQAREPTLAAGWFAHNNDCTAFQFFTQNRERLLRLISAKTFVHKLGHASAVGRIGSTPKAD